MKNSKTPVLDFKFERIIHPSHFLCNYCNYPFIIIDEPRCPNCKCSIPDIVRGLKRD